MANESLPADHVCCWHAATVCCECGKVDIPKVHEHWREGAREYFADCPTVLDIIRRGDDPREDR